MEISKCETLGRGRMRIIFGNGVRCRVYRAEAEQFGLHEGADIPQETYERLMREILGPRAVKRAMHLLEQMDRTEYKLRQKLSEAEYPQSCIDDAVLYVKRYHYLDDARYAANFVRCAQERRSRGQIRRKLLERGISRELAEEAIEQEYAADETAQIRNFLQKRNFSPDASDPKEFQRTYQSLVRRGFPGSLVIKEMKADIVLDI